jgi:hypothetical protein
MKMENMAREIMVIAGRNEDGEHGKGEHGARREPSGMQVSMQESRTCGFQCRSL